MAKKKKQDGPTELVIGTAEGVPLARVPFPAREQIRYLWTRLQVHDGMVPRSIGVTSHSSGEGVSFTSLALATVLARTGPTVLVEANWWGTGLPLPEPGPGLAGLLRGSNTVEDAVVATSQSGLSIVPAGALVESGQAVMANTESMQVVINNLYRRYASVVLDLPSISTSASALSFAAAAEATLLVAKQRSTRIDNVQMAADELRHTRLVGVVLNESKVSLPRFLERRLVSA